MPRTFWGDAIARFRRNRLAVAGLGVVLLLALVALGASAIAPEGYDVTHFDQPWQFPSAEHWFGTDPLGRDFFSRIVYGARISLLVGLSAQAIAFGIGLPLGLLAGVRRGRTEFLVMRVVDALWSFPRMLFALLIMTVLGSASRTCFWQSG